tara:strand:+ start:2922 stop:3974 length:1053 start_codon:yes stop_codon:yes gene_type:complete
MAVFTTINDPSAHFQAELYTGNGVDGTAQTFDGNSDLQPDLIWIKARNFVASNIIFDSTRGVTKYIYTDENNAEATDDNRILSLDSNGFTTGTNVHTNDNNDTYVAYGWKVNGGSTSSNTAGNMTSTVQANTTAGISILTYTGNGSAAQTVGHGLGATADLVMIKNRGQTDSWHLLFRSIATFDSGSITSTLFPTGAGGGRLGINYTSGSSNYNQDGQTNTNTETYIVYCFTSIHGYSKFGRWQGNGNEDGPFVYTGFKPAFVMAKGYAGTDDWIVLDHKRSGYNPENEYLDANNAAAESDGSGVIDFLSNGFKMRSTFSSLNYSSGEYVYMAFAENPFVTSTGIPATAR